MIPGWPYSMMVALEPGRSSWTAPLDAQRLAPGDDAATVTATQLRQLVARLIAAGQWRPGDPDILIVADAGYDAPRLAWLLRDLPVQVLARMRADRVLRRAAPPWIPPPHAGRPPRHGSEFIFGDPRSWGASAITTRTDTRLYGTATALAWDRLHPRLTRRAAWTGSGELPIIAGTVIRLPVDRLPSGAIPKPVWLWWSGIDATPGRRRPAVAGVPPPLRPRTHLPNAQADTGLDLPEDPHPAGRRPVDLAHPRRLHPTPAGPTTRRRPAPTMGETRSTRPALTPPASAATFGTCAPRPPAPPPHPNQPDQDPHAHPADPTPDPPHDTTSTSPPPRPARRHRRRRRRQPSPAPDEQVKDQASQCSVTEMAPFTPLLSRARTRA
jgi:hypothetical protein